MTNLSINKEKQLWKPYYFLSLAFISVIIFSSNEMGQMPTVGISTDSIPVEITEAWTYQENFEDRDLGAWASYPLWQDIAYNQNFRVNEIIPGDPNISLVQKVTPYTAVDNYAGAQKLLNFYLVPGSKLTFRYYLKTHQNCEWYKIRLAAGPFGKLDVTIPDAKENQWREVTVKFEDFVKENPNIAGREKIRIYALAFLAKFPNADPDMPIYLGLDDIAFQVERPAPFRFAKPSMHKLPEFKPYIPKEHYYAGDNFELVGKWSSKVKEISLDITSFSDGSQVVFNGDLMHEGEVWKLNPVKLAFPEGLYLGTLRASDGIKQIGETTFTMHIAPRDLAGQHPRLLFDSAEKKNIDQRFKEDRFQKVYEDIKSNAREMREKIPVESLHFELDQFPEEDWLPTWDAWGSKIYHTGAALRLNARAFAFHDDEVAGEYVKQVLLRLSAWPNWTHPWQTKRGRYSEHRTGSWSHRVAEAYDLVYPFLTEDERTSIRTAIMKNIVQGVHRTYIHNDNITAATSNWLAMTVGGSLMCLSAMFNDGEYTRHIEPYFTGAILKLDKFLHKVTDTKDGGWGEGFGYNNYSFSNLSYSLPSLENVFNIDLSKPLVGTYQEYIWAGLIKKKRWFEYGDSRGNLTSVRNWAYLLSKYKEPQLSWFYDFLKENKTNYVANEPPTIISPSAQSSENEAYEDVIFNTTNIPKEDPFNKNPVKLFRDIGTVVFKSGWEADDFVFVMRSGPAYNHQHLDQGSFWLADRGQVFIAERPLSNSHYYDDPIYESWLTQPIGHSTILVDGNHQSQRVGDHLSFAPGFDDHAYVSHFLDGKNASFATGDIGRLYWGKVKALSRNVLFIKPRVVLMLDVAIPTAQDVDINLLYQTEHLADIQPGQEKSIIKKGGHSLEIHHLFPPKSMAKAVETPHYLKTLRSGQPLEREGMLTVNNKTKGVPLIVANLLTTPPDSDPNALNYEMDAGYASGEVSGTKFAFQTRLDAVYEVEGISTDALAITWDESVIFVAKAKSFANQRLRILTDHPITFEISSDKRIKYYVEKDTEIRIGIEKRPSSITLNGETVDTIFDQTLKEITLSVPGGEGTLTIQ